MPCATPQWILRSWIQKSIESEGFAGSSLSYQERRIYRFHEQLDALIGRERVAEDLRVAPLLEGFVEG